MPDNIIKVISTCHDCPCFFEECESVMSEGFNFCSLSDQTNKPVVMKHDVDEGIDPECPLRKSNYVLSLKDK